MIDHVQGFKLRFELTEARRTQFGGAHFFLPDRRHGFILKVQFAYGLQAVASLMQVNGRRRGRRVPTRRVCGRASELDPRGFGDALGSPRRSARSTRRVNEFSM